tara:strand:- start:43 stop:1359 length:1317 start_codon:yes stop_codon:yes gene_type:complete
MGSSSLINTELLSLVSEVINNLSTELGISFRALKGLEYVIECDDDRVETQKKLEIDLENIISGISISRVTKNDSIEHTVISGYGKTLRIVYKLASGGQSETTLNSTITELFPAVAWDQNLKATLSVSEFAKQVTYGNAKVKIGSKTPYKNKPAHDAGTDFINKSTNSSKFDEKVSAALGIYKWLKFQDRRRRIDGIVWGYRDNTKPTGVNSNHKGDIFIMWKGNSNPTITGVSIKAGGLATKPPQFNSYIRATLNSPAFGMIKEYDNLQKESFDEIYSKIPGMNLSYSQYGKPQMTQIVARFERSNSKVYNELYDLQLNWLRQTLVNIINDNQEKSKKWLLEEVCKEQQDVPLVVIQSAGSKLKNVKEVSDEDIIKECVSVAKKVNARVGTGKQNWHIDLTCNEKTTTLNFTIRTNGPGIKHKLGQYVNLAVKFNGIK